MEIKVVEEKDNKFFERKDLKLELRHANAATPAKAELTKELAKRYDVDEAQVVIDYIFTKKGLAESTVKVKILKEKPKVVPKKEGPKKEKVEKKVEKPKEEKIEKKEEARERGEKTEAQASKAE